MGRPMASTEPKASDEHHDGEGDADQLGLGRLDRCQVLAADQDLEPLDRRGLLGDQLADAARLGVVDVGRQVHLGERQLAGQRPGRGDLAGALVGVGRDDGRARCSRGPGLHRGSRRRRWRRGRSMAATTTGSSTPWSAWNTIMPDWPPVPSSGKCSSRTANPAVLSESGTTDPLPNAGPTAPAAARTITRTAAQSPTVARRWSKHQPPRRPSRESRPGGRAAPRRPATGGGVQEGGRAATWAWLPSSGSPIGRTSDVRPLPHRPIGRRPDRPFG